MNAARKMRASDWQQKFHNGQLTINTINSKVNVKTSKGSNKPWAQEASTSSHAPHERVALARDANHSHSGTVQLLLAEMTGERGKFLLQLRLVLIRDGGKPQDRLLFGGR